MKRITEIKRTLTGRVDTFLCDVFSQDEEQLVAVFRLPAARDVHGVLLPAGTITVGYFWRSRPYNLYHWVQPSHGTMAYYFNIGDVGRFDSEVIEWDDLAVDVLATPGTQPRVLDEDEIPADIDPHRREYIFAARDEVLRDLGRLIETAERMSSLVLQKLNGC